MRSLGCDEVIDYTSHDIFHAGDRFDAGFDLIGGKTLEQMIISHDIRSRARRADVSYRYLFMHPSGTELAELGKLIEQGKLKVIIDKTSLFEKMPEALAYVESGHAKGKVVVMMS